jgi:uncharacterized coiled-coil DUF342 family protein
MVVLVVLIIPGLAGAEFYKYRDANGVLRFTDDISEVPEDQRAKLKEYKSVVTPKPVEEVTDAQSGPKKSELEAMAQKLEAEKTALEEEYQTILDEDRRIKAMTEDPENPPSPEEYNQQLRALRKKIDAYDARRRDFQERAAAFDAHVQKQ